MRKIAILLPAAAVLLAGGVLLGNLGSSFAAAPPAVAEPASAKVSESAPAPGTAESGWRETKDKPKAIRKKSPR